MAIPAQYQEISVEGLPALSERMQTEGHRFVQVLAVNTEAGIDVQYTFMKDGVLEVFTIKGVTPESAPSPASPTALSRRSCSRTRSTTCSA